jgi:hypothetical protein
MHVSWGIGVDLTSYNQIAASVQIRSHRDFYTLLLLDI